MSLKALRFTDHYTLGKKLPHLYLAFEGESKDTKQPVWIFKRNLIKESAIFQVMKELKDIPNVISPIDAFVSDHDVYVITESLPSKGRYSLADYISCQKKTGYVSTVGEIRKIAKVLVTIVEDLAAKNLAILNLSPSDIFFTRDKLVFANIVDLKPYAFIEYTPPTTRFEAPELYYNPLPSGYNPIYADIWSVGVILYVITMGKYPHTQIQSIRYEKPNKFEIRKFGSLFDSMIAREYYNRPQPKEILRILEMN